MRFVPNEGIADLVSQFRDKFSCFVSQPRCGAAGSLTTLLLQGWCGGVSELIGTQLLN
jgi:hypothetical protein